MSKSSKNTAKDPFSHFLIENHARTLGANVTNVLREAIIRGELRPGAPLGQEFLARTFGVSRVPIRESLRQLAAEGLVELAPHKGAFVAHLTLEELDELYGIIWSLETLAAREGVPKLTDADIAAMAALVKECDAISDPAEWYRASCALHHVVVAASGWLRCVRIVDECRRNIGRYVIDQPFFAAHVNEWRERNRALYEACRKRDAEAAVAALGVMRTLSTAQVRAYLKETLAARKKKGAERVA